MAALRQAAREALATRNEDELDAIEKETFELQKEARRMALILAGEETDLLKVKIAAAQAERKRVEDDMSGATRGGGSSASSHSSITSPGKSGADFHQIVKDDDDREVLVTNKNSMNDRIRASLAFKRACDDIKSGSSTAWEVV